MASITPEGMDEYLRATELCDSNHDEIKAQAQKLVENAESPKEAVLNIFHYVRDQIMFGMDHCDVKASETMNKGMGFCITKTNLQVALLRAAKIPARYHRAVLSKSCLKGIISAFAYRATPDRIWWHPWCECFLSGKWTSCDSLLDKALYEALRNKGTIRTEQIPTIDWNGEDDLNTMHTWMLEDLGTFGSLDDLFNKVQKEVLPPKFIAGFLFRISNRYTNKLRNR
jgi:hypothetical protein